ncbi:YjgF-like protein [Thozetella sp. PMI_491]|nr:YjgF-like protein [Thozetella sp. PMI_491]
MPQLRSAQHLRGLPIIALNRSSISPRFRSTSAAASAKKRPILTANAPKPLPGLYNQAIVAGGIVYCSGTVAVDPETGRIVEGDIRDRTHRCIKNLTAVLEAAGTKIDNVVKVNVYLSNEEDFDKMNEVYMTYWGEIKPCRTCVIVKTLPLNYDIEIECVAVL